MRVTIIYDNTSLREDLRADWGFSALVEARGEGSSSTPERGARSSSGT
jgi:metal-dependent hydrolase (beta-lactamase superfamily II)